jgi:AAA15 family ATPase/GTPase
MILEIRLANFFSINEEIILDFRAGNIKTYQSDKLPNNIFSFENTKVLKTIALYGANASGKSNIIKAIRFCVSMIINSHNHNENVNFNFNPFKFKGMEKKASYFYIRFVIKNIEYKYTFTLTTNEIVKEELYYYPNGRKSNVFKRDESLGNEKREKYSFGKGIKRPMDIAENTSKKTLFLSRASQMDREIAKDIFKFFSQNFILAYTGFNSLSIEYLFNENKSALLKALQIADSDIVDIILTKEKKVEKNFNADFISGKATVEDKELEYLKIITFHKSSPKTAFDFFTEESDGTQVLFYIMLTIIDVIKNNKILLIDEIENSLHIQIVEYIIELFNVSQSAQLIFSTHNTGLLNLDKFRKDQIFFVNKKEDSSSELYSLFDYKDFRDTMDLEKAYLQGRFDAIPYINRDLDDLKYLLNEP